MRSSLNKPSITFEESIGGDGAVHDVHDLVRGEGLPGLFATVYGILQGEIEVLEVYSQHMASTAVSCIFSNIPVSYSTLRIFKNKGYSCRLYLFLMR